MNGEDVQAVVLLFIVFSIIGLSGYGVYNMFSGDRDDAMQFVSGTEYYPGDAGEVAVMVTDYQGNPVTASYACNYTVYYPNKTIFVQANMTGLTSEGTRYGTFTVPGDYGVYEYVATCTSGPKKVTAAKSFHVGTATDILLNETRNAVEIVSQGVSEARLGKTVANTWQFSASSGVDLGVPACGIYLIDGLARVPVISKSFEQDFNAVGYNITDDWTITGAAASPYVGGGKLYLAHGGSLNNRAILTSIENISGLKTTDDWTLTFSWPGDPFPNMMWRYVVLLNETGGKVGGVSVGTLVAGGADGHLLSVYKSDGTRQAVCNPCAGGYAQGFGIWQLTKTGNEYLLTFNGNATAIIGSAGGTTQLQGNNITADPGVESQVTQIQLFGQTNNPLYTVVMDDISLTNQAVGVVEVDDVNDKFTLFWESSYELFRYGNNYEVACDIPYSTDGGKTATMGEASQFVYMTNEGRIRAVVVK